MLTKKQKEILDFIKDYIEENDYAPSLQEIGRKFKLSSLATVHQHIENLKQKGYLKKEKSHHRSIELISDNRSLDSIDLVEIPLLGTIAAGQPIEAIEEKEKIKIPRNFVSKSGENFALKVQGDSMIDEGIFDGDTVIIKKQETANNGETVVALLNDSEVTLKKIFKEKNGFRLQPANSNLKPIFTKELQVQGKVISIIRNFNELKRKVEEKKELTDITVKYMENTDINHRKSLGQYFTPKTIREAILSKLPNKKINPKILDPGCGTGEFLITADKYFKNPDIHGWDIDRELIDVAKENIPRAKLKNLDALLSQDYNKYDFVIGNPPYFEFSPPKEIRGKFREVINGRINIFSLFIYQGIKLLKKDGYLAFVVPPSMNNGAYFAKLRNFIVDNTNIEYLHVLNDPKLFSNALQSTMLFILKKGENKGNYLFKKNGILIFSENCDYLEKSFKNKLTLNDLNHKVRTGRLTWNQNKNLLTNNPKEGVPLIWAHNITPNGLKLPIINDKKPQYIKINNYDVGPAVVVNRITGSVGSSRIKVGIIPPKMKFIAENHVNVIFPPQKQEQIGIDFKTKQDKKRKFLSLEDLVRQLSSTKKMEIVKNITGNTQISKTELENLFPIEA